MNMYEMWEIQDSGRTDKHKEEKVGVKIPLAIPTISVKPPQKKRGRPRKNK